MATPPVLAIRTKSGEELAARRRAPWVLPAIVILLGSVLAGSLFLLRNRAVEAPDAGVRPTTPPTSAPQAVPPISRDTAASALLPGADAAGTDPRRLAASHARRADSLDAELAGLAARVGLDGLLAVERLAASDSLRASRTALDRFSSGLESYRSHQQALSKVFNDSADILVLKGAWDQAALREWQVRVRRPEPAGAVARADLLIASLDSLLALLQEHQGGYEITAADIRFRAPRASLQYEDIVRAINASRVSPSEQLSAPLTVLGQALAGYRLPRTAHD